MDLRLVTALDEEQTKDLHLLYRNEWWTRDREIDDVRRMLAHSDYVFGLCTTGPRRLVAFARVLTDRVFKAFLFDVIVAPDYRRTGVGKLLVDHVLRHPDLVRVAHFELYCLPELVPFYERWGFSADVGGIVFLRRARAS
jgi:GNAT superfamily N-acetyltransferase